MYLLVNEGELSTFGPGGRFGDLLFNTLGFKPADQHVKASPHGQNINNEYITSKDPDIILAMDRGSVVSGKSSAKQVLKMMLLNMLKLSNQVMYMKLILNYGTLVLVVQQQPLNKSRP